MQELAAHLESLGIVGPTLMTHDALHHAALVQMIERHSRFVYRIAYAVVRNPADAEDIAQETFLQLLRQPHPNVIENERAYLARTAWRLAVRRKQHPSASELPLQFTSAGLPSPAFPSADLPSAAASPEADAIDSQNQAWLLSHIDALPEKLRQPLALTALGELSSPEIAVILGLPEGTVRRRIHTARQLLRKQWEKRKGIRP